MTDQPPESESKAGGRRASDHEKPPEQHHVNEKNGWVPRPPRTNSATDFIVIIFSITVATILIILTLGVVLAGIFGADIKSYFAILTSIITSMISALVGYLAGKGAGRADAEREQ